MVPYGFCEDIKVETKSTYELMRKRHMQEVSRFPERNQPWTPNMQREAGRVALDHVLAAVTGGSPRSINMRRRAIVAANRPDMAPEEIPTYITGRGYWERDPRQIREQENE
jgi:hypothetical protein